MQEQGETNGQSTDFPWSDVEYWKVLSVKEQQWRSL